ncbi:MAG: hypothetical protein SWO11_18295 [Thermodesulfobacteriota bacterium]|nr:hypothetical protein [Thermodesulfobacteriota bacterium]
MALLIAYGVYPTFLRFARTSQKKDDQASSLVQPTFKGRYGLWVVFIVIGRLLPWVLPRYRPTLLS